MSKFYRSNALIGLYSFFTRNEGKFDSEYDTIKIKVSVSTVDSTIEKQWMNITKEELEKIIDVIRKGDNNEN